MSEATVSSGRPGSSESSGSPWELVESGFDPERANTWETLFTVGNGRLGTRGSLEEGHVGEQSGTFLAGVYDGFEVPVLDLVNAPDWLALSVHVDGRRLDVQSCEVVEHERALDYRHGVLRRRTVLRDVAGRRTELRSWRTASMADRSVCALQVEVTPLDGPAQVTVESALDGARRNLERQPLYPPGTTFGPLSRWDKWARARHLEVTGTAVSGDDIVLTAHTLQTGVALCYVAATTCSRDPSRSAVRHDHERVATESDFTLDAGETLVVDKLVSIATSRDADAVGRDLAEVALERLESHRTDGVDGVLRDSAWAWEAMWDDCDVEIEGDPESTVAVRYGIYQLLIAANGEDPTVNIGAKSLTGEGYRGHVFWDTEVMMLPFFMHTQPDTARSLLRYRHHTLPGAREVAAESGYAGARFPWESADSGREECPRTTPDGANVFWTRDEEVHVSADVAYGFLKYAEVTGDHDLLFGPGAETIFETSRFWVSRCEPAPADADGTHSITMVMGPDEFHSHVHDNAFTNRLAAWHLEQAALLYGRLSREAPEALARVSAAIGLDADEVRQWRTVSAGLARARERDGVIEQFRGYFDRLDVPVVEWDENDMPRYPAGYHHFNCEDTMLLKQPDVLMAMLMLPEEFTAQQQRASFEFYEARTLHKSSLSPAIHAIIGLGVGDTSRALQYFRRSAFVDLHDNQGNTHEGIHIASAGGTWQVLVFGFAGLRVVGGRLSLQPWLPPQWQGLRFRLRWRGRPLEVHIDADAVTLTLRPGSGQDAGRDVDATETVTVAGREVELVPGEPTRVARHLVGQSASAQSHSHTAAGQGES